MDFLRISGFGFRVSAVGAVTCGILLSGIAGCGVPNAANIALRKQNDSLQDQITQLDRRHAGDAATIAAYQQNRITIPMLPQARLDRLFTTHGLEFGHLTGGYRADQSTNPSDGIEVEIVPTDEQGDEIKAAGAFTIEAFDLDEPNHPLIGTWHFPLEESRKHFFDHLMLYTYVLDCPWNPAPPKHPNLTIKVTFTDELTGRQFTAQRQVQVQLNPTTQPGPSPTPIAG